LRGRPDVEDPRDATGLGRVYRQVAPYMGIGIEFTAAILLCLWAGWWVDGRFGTGPAFTLIGAFLGMSAGFYNLYRAVVGLGRKTRKPPGPGGSP
jgi:F0F1-type ATP synthase assembly protein I